MPVFQREPQHEYIGEFWSEKCNREERDKTLYFDTQKQVFFVIESSEIESGPNVYPNFSKKVISKQDARDIIASRPDLPELAQKAARYFEK